MLRSGFAIALFLCGTPALAETIGNAEVCFVPGPQDCAGLAAGEIGKARHTIDMQAYQFTEPHIALALSEAKARGIAVRLIVDKHAPGEKNGQTDALAERGIAVFVDTIPHIAHNKVIVIDGDTVVTGSFNWTANADLHNAENLLVLHDPALAAAYAANFASRLAVSETYSPACGSECG